MQQQSVRVAQFGNSQQVSKLTQKSQIQSNITLMALAIIIYWSYHTK